MRLAIGIGFWVSLGCVSREGSDSDADTDSDTDADTDSDTDAEPTCGDLGGTCRLEQKCGDGCEGETTPATGRNVGCAKYKDVELCCVPNQPDDSCAQHGGRCATGAACPDDEELDPGQCAAEGDICCVAFPC